MSGAFVCACSVSGAAIMGKSPASLRADDYRLSPAERLEIISLIAAVGSAEGSAWIVPMLERGGPDEEPTMET
jgi:hypothetical protein